MNYKPDSVFYHELPLQGIIAGENGDALEYRALGQEIHPKKIIIRGAYFRDGEDFCGPFTITLFPEDTWRAKLGQVLKQIWSWLND